MLAKAKTFDVFVNFSLMGVIRQLKLNELPTKQEATLDKVMSDIEWIQKIYQPSEQLPLPLFGDPQLTRDTIRAEWLARLYTNQISTLFSFISQPVIMMNSRNAPLYALFLASHNERAVKIVDDIFKRYEHLRDVGQ